MDIYSILASKPHNPHYLKRYVDFIEGCQKVNENYIGYTEKHHICPKAKDLFPEYRSFKDHPWNCVVLTARQHFIAHLILCKCFYKSKSVWYSIKMMLNFNKEIIPKSKLYEELKIKYSKTISENYKNTKVVRQKDGSYKRVPINDVVNSEGTSKGFIWINDGISEKTQNKKSIIPNGWVKGRLKRNIKLVYITNGKKNKRIKVDQELPSGWYYGFTKSERKNRGSKGMIFITNGNENSCVDKHSEIPVGWYKGRTIKNKSKMSSTKGKMWINNGTKSILINKERELPEGWVKGRLPWL